MLFASGWFNGGPAGAKGVLEAFWQEVAAFAEPLHRSGLASVLTGPGAQLVSPYQVNPFDFNPLRELLERLVDFERLRAERSLRLLIATTALRTGSLRLFASLWGLLLGLTLLWSLANERHQWMYLQATVSLWAGQRWKQSEFSANQAGQRPICEGSRRMA